MGRKDAKLKVTDTPKDIVVKMCEGNPGAINVMMSLLMEPGIAVTESVRDLLHMDDMGMRGPDIWIGYKDYCKQDLKKFRAAIRSRDPEMVQVITGHGYDVACYGRS